MAIQSTPFPLVIDADDFQRVDHGIRWAIKFHEIPSFGEAVYGVWFVGGVMNTEALDSAFDIHISEYEGDAMRWAKEYLLPRLNAFLAKVFKVGGERPPLPPLAQAFNAVKGLKITAHPDGTVAASFD